MGSATAFQGFSESHPSSSESRAKARGTNDGVASLALFYMPWGIAVDRSGNLFVADAYNHTIRKGVPSGAGPTLEISLVGSQVVISWPTASSGFRLHTSPTLNLASPGSWTAVSNGIVTVGDRYLLTNTPGPDPAFFRLRKP